MILSGWGRYPKVDAECLVPLTAAEVARTFSERGALIARGLGRSYGDSALADRVVSSRYLDKFMVFDAASGWLHCESGVSLDDILRSFVPRGWFLPVSPGTRFVTVGGAIASDVHGKNHHVAGSFCEHVESVDILLANGERVRASQNQNAELLRATCGGMGLTGMIVSATVRLKRISSSRIIETSFRVPDLDSVLSAFEDSAGSTYSVAWIDCLARGKNLGRSIIMLGEHATEGGLVNREKRALPVPCDMPASLLNPFTVRAFNSLYYGNAPRRRRTRVVAYEAFFYPLDSLSNWNRLYGKNGLLQYQCVLPRQAGLRALRELLELIAAAGIASFLAVLKLFGRGNDNLLSFPMEGYTLALDFKAEPRTFELLEQLDQLVSSHGGRVYLAKDARMSAESFRAGYPRWEQFEAVRANYGALGKFSSLQSRRLGLG